MGEITVRQLVQQYRAHNPEGVFFNRDVLACYGERLREMMVNGKGVIRNRSGENRSGESRICWELKTVQRHPLLGRREKLYYFDADTYEEVIPEDEATTTPWIKEAG